MTAEPPWLGWTAKRVLQGTASGLNRTRPEEVTPEYTPMGIANRDHCRAGAPCRSGMARRKRTLDAAERAAVELAKYARYDATLLRRHSLLVLGRGAACIPIWPPSLVPLHVDSGEPGILWTPVSSTSR